ncbi:MAG: LacI family DNA-binding transcriptional regulator [Candidatus Eisenbacteria bacterium]|uniref:LacI family DNA-binding transcriptional regulator n=1 Tax=Eiseniibacteriota bacterium TaxID=2212470 RepID=A0A849SDK3_UNCEI|nr:LacI family DNA-binding transcriptional regulator [Candidatus Eisenbacteria bacterium]
MATIRDVAREAGVSIATISRVFNASARVSEDTTSRVREVAERMGYWPNGAARSLITKRTNAIGVLLPDLYGEFFSEVIRGIDLTARREGYHLVVSSSHADSNELLTALQTVRGRIDGLIVMAPDLADSAPFDESALRFPIVLVNPGFTTTRCASVSTDNVTGARAMVRHLAALGHREIAFIGGPPSNLDARQRQQGYHEALAELGLPATPGLEVTGSFTESSGFEATRELLSRTRRLGAIFCANDCMAVGAMSALRQAGLRVPDDVALAGFDDISIASYLTPRLSSVRVEASRLGERAVQLLLGCLARVAAPGPRQPMPHEILPTSLVVRESSGATPDRVMQTANGSAVPSS